MKSKKGLVIAVEGTDGSGKSFIINAITPKIEKLGYEVIYNHLRPNAIPDLGVLLGKKKAKKKGEVIVVSDPHKGKQSGLLGSLFRWGYYMIDYTFGYMKNVWLYKNGKVFIFDRYYYEYYFDQKRSRTNLPLWIVRIGECLIPSPDVILCLGGDPEKIYARKPETSLEEVQRQTDVLKAFCENHLNAVWIETTVEPTKSIDSAMNAINKTMR